MEIRKGSLQKLHRSRSARPWCWIFPRPTSFKGWAALRVQFCGKPRRFNCHTTVVIRLSFCALIIPLRTANAGQLVGVCVHVRACARTSGCFHCNWICPFSFSPQYGWAVQSSLTPHPPASVNINYSLLTVPKQSCHSKVAALQGFTAPVCHFPGCHSLGKHLLFSVAVMQPGHASETHSAPSSRLRRPRSVCGACGIETPTWQREKWLRRYTQCSQQYFSDFIAHVSHLQQLLTYTFWWWVWAGSEILYLR